jgi:hypothetical protein
MIKVFAETPRLIFRGIARESAKVSSEYAFKELQLKEVYAAAT